MYKHNSPTYSFSLNTFLEYFQIKDFKTFFKIMLMSRNFREYFQIKNFKTFLKLC